MLTTSARAVPDVHAALDADIGMRFIDDDFFSRRVLDRRAARHCFVW